MVWIVSTTKAITATAVLQQVEAGRLSLDAPIGEVLPELAQPMVLLGCAPEGGEAMLWPASTRWPMLCGCTKSSSGRAATIGPSNR